MCCDPYDPNSFKIQRQISWWANLSKAPVFAYLNIKIAPNIYSLQFITVQTLVWIFKHTSPLCFGKKYITYLKWLFLPSLSFYEVLREKLQLYGWFLRCFCAFTVLTSLSTGVTNRLFQVNEVNWLLLTFSWRLWSSAGTGISPLWLQWLKFYVVDRGVRKCQRTFCLMMPSPRPVLCHSEWGLKRQRDDIFINTLVCVCKRKMCQTHTNTHTNLHEPPHKHTHTGT